MRKNSQNDNLPPYFVDFFKLYLAEEAKDTKMRKNIYHGKTAWLRYIMNMP